MRSTGHAVIDMDMDLDAGRNSGSSEATRGLHEVERWKDKIEVRLDNRQVFFLFFGSVLVACLLFILGVVVGKRMESRARAAAVTPETEDPLALLDKVAARAPQRLLVPAAPRTAAVAIAKPEAKPAEPAARTAPPVAPGPAPRAAAPTAAVAPSPAPAVAAKPPVPPAKLAAPPAKTGRFTLQLGSFQDRGEAESFARQFAHAGSYILVSDVPGKGTWFRVRAGEYANAKEAEGAKAAFERQHNKIVYVAPR